jgi:hypothetical protein
MEGGYCQNHASFLQQPFEKAIHPRGAERVNYFRYSCGPMKKMSRNDEDRILHGLYYYRESIEEEVPVTGEQVLWLAMHPLREGEAWHKEGRLQSVDASAFPADVQSKLVTAKLELPLRYLQYRRLIKYSGRSDATLSIAVTFAGADRAIRLHTRRGRMDLWYREHKDGILGLIMTVIVSLVTALITVRLMR